MISKIFVSIASYRDPDLINTVKSCYENAKNRDEIFFSIFSQAEDWEHPDLSFVPSSQIDYKNCHWSVTKGTCWARKATSENIIAEYFLQIDSHSRFIKNWDESIVNSYKKSQTYWGDEIILTNYPDSYEIDWSANPPIDIYTSNLSNDLWSLRPFWDTKSKMVQAEWYKTINKNFGDEIYFISANSLFTTSDIMKKIPYDENLYFTGEEPSLAIRAYTRSIKIISPAIKYMYTNFNRDNGRRKFHWIDDPEWWKLNKASYIRLSKIMTGDKEFGIYGIDSLDLFDEYQQKAGINLIEKKDEIASI